MRTLSGMWAGRFLVLPGAGQAPGLANTDLGKIGRANAVMLRRFRTEEGKQSLHRVLRAYAAYDEEVNYCQVRACGGANGRSLTLGSI